MSKFSQRYISRFAIPYHVMSGERPVTASLTIQFWVLSQPEIFEDDANITFCWVTSMANIT